VVDGANTGQAKTPGYWTTADLQYLDANNLHFDFFINTNNACGDLSAPGPDPKCIAAIQDILMLHNPANHTVHHWALGTPGPGGCGDSACVDSEMQGVEAVIDTVSNEERPHLTRWRPPFGDPYLSMGAGLAWVQPGRRQVRGDRAVEPGLPGFAVRRR
jgi:hypothetical protein